MSESPSPEPAFDLDAHLHALEPPARRDDARAVGALMQALTGAPPRDWGHGIVGFGRYRYRYDSGREGEWFVCGFAARKAHLVLYFPPGFKGREAMLARLGRHKSGAGCLYVKRLADIDTQVLREIIAACCAATRARQA